MTGDTLNRLRQSYPFIPADWWDQGDPFMLNECWGGPEADPGRAVHVCERAFIRAVDDAGQLLAVNAMRKLDPAFVRVCEAAAFALLTGAPNGDAARWVLAAPFAIPELDELSERESNPDIAAWARTVRAGLRHSAGGPVRAEAPQAAQTPVDTTTAQIDDGAAIAQFIDCLRAVTMPGATEGQQFEVMLATLHAHPAQVAINRSAAERVRMAPRGHARDREWLPLYDPFAIEQFMTLAVDRDPELREEAQMRISRLDAAIARFQATRTGART